MATRSLNVVISGDAKPLGVATRKAGEHIDDVEQRGHKMGKTLALGFAAAGAAAAGALVVGLKKSVDAAVEAEKSQAKLKAQLAASGVSYRAHAKEIDAVIQKHSRLAGVDDEDLQDAFTGLVRATGSVSASMKDMGLVTDIMRGKHIEAGAAGALLAKVHNGNVTALKKMGIAIDPVTKAQDKLKESNKNATKEQVAAAKAADKTATAQKGIAELQKRFGGQAAAYGKTAAGAQDRFAVAMENVQEKLGAKLLPVLATVANAVAKFLSQIDRGTGLGGRFAAAVSEGFGRVKAAVEAAIPTAVAVFGKLKTAITGVVTTVSGVVRGFQQGKGGAVALVAAVAGLTTAFVAYKVAVGITAAVTKAYAGVQAALNVVMTANPIGLLVVGLVGLGAALVVAYKKSDTFRAAVDGAFKAVKTIVGGVMDWLVPKVTTAFGAVAAVVGATVSVVRGYVHAYAKAATAIVDAIIGAFNFLKGLPGKVAGYFSDVTARIRGWAGNFASAALSLGKGIGSGIISGLGSLGHLLLSKVGDALGFVTKNIPGLGAATAVGKAIGSLVGDGVGKTARGVLPSGGAFGGSLMGAQTALKPFAAIGSRFGLSVSSGRRPGSITTSGNVSYHSSGEAIDMADGRGPDANKMNFFRYMKSRFGGQLAELIYGPGQVGVKDGRPYNFGPALNAQHMDHVHVAFDTGKPGVGDGIGQIKALWTQAGGSTVAQNTAAAIAMAESGGREHATNRNSDGSIDRGLWQINSSHGAAMSTFDPLGNARAAVSISSNGRNWNPWTVFRTGAYRQFLGVAGKTKADGGKGGKAKGPKQLKDVTRSGGALGGYDPSVVYADDTNSAGDPFTPSDAASTQGFVNAQSGKQLLTRPLKGGGPTKGRTQEEKDTLAAGAPAPGPTADDFALSAVARARLTDGTGDDIAALQALLGIRKTALDKALSDSDPRNDGDAIDAFLAVKDALTQLTDAAKANTDAIDAQRKQYETLIAQDYRSQYNVSQSQYAILAQAISDVANGQIGQRLGLNLSGLRSAPGAVART